MKRTFFIAVLLCLLASAFNTYATEFYSHKINSDNGLPDNDVRNVALDKQGFLWIGTPNGLYRYDGYFYT